MNASSLTLENLFLDELAERYDAEQRVLTALPGFTKGATDPELQKAFHCHLLATSSQIKKIEQVFCSFGKEVCRSTSDPTSALLQQAVAVGSSYGGTQVMDAALICVAQKISHLEIASYGCLYEWAVLLANKDATSILQDVLEEEKAANETLTELARAYENAKALPEGLPDISQDTPPDE